MRTTILWRSLPLLTACSLAPAIVGAQGEPLPLDPLTPRERAMADTIARADSRVRQFITQGPSRLINVDFADTKDPADTAGGQDVPPRRSAEALYYRSDTDQGLRALVDLTGRRVTAISSVPGPSVPLSADEIATAGRLALGNPRVGQMLGVRAAEFRVATRPATLAGADSARVEGLRAVSTNPQDPCYRRRCVALFFRVGRRYVQMNRVVVDITRQQVMVKEGPQ